MLEKLQTCFSSSSVQQNVYKVVFNNILDNNLISSNQSGFKQVNSRINQLIALIRDTYKGFDDGFFLIDQKH